MPSGRQGDLGRHDRRGGRPVGSGRSGGPDTTDAPEVIRRTLEVASYLSCGRTSTAASYSAFTMATRASLSLSESSGNARR